jgi:hypothetical protein
MVLKSARLDVGAVYHSCIMCNDSVQYDAFGMLPLEAAKHGCVILPRAVYCIYSNTLGRRQVLY